MSTRILKNQRGFTGLEVVLMVVVAALVVGAGVYVYDHRKAANTDSNQDTIDVKSASNKAVKLDTVKAKTTVQAFYDEYLKAAGSNTVDAPNPVAEKAAVSAYGNTAFVDFYAQNRSYDPVVCGQDTPSSISITNVTSDETSASAEVDENYSGTINKVTVKLDSQYKVKSITCPNI